MVSFRKGQSIARKRHSSEQIINKLRAIEVHLAAGMTQAQAANREEVSVHTVTCVAYGYATPSPSFNALGTPSSRSHFRAGLRTFPPSIEPLPVKHIAVQATIGPQKTNHAYRVNLDSLGLLATFHTTSRF